MRKQIGPTRQKLRDALSLSVAKDSRKFDVDEVKKSNYSAT